MCELLELLRKCRDGDKKVTEQLLYAAVNRREPIPPNEKQEIRKLALKLNRCSEDAANALTYIVGILSQGS